MHKCAHTHTLSLSHTHTTYTNTHTHHSLILASIGRRGLEALGQLRYLAEVDLSESWGVTDDV